MHRRVKTRTGTRVSQTNKPIFVDSKPDAQTLPASSIPIGPFSAVNDAGLNSLAVLESLGDVVYEWNIQDDTLSWSANVDEVLGIPRGAIGTGRGFARHLDPDNLVSRYDTVHHSPANDLGSGIPYQIEYAFLPDLHRPDHILWIEDNGRWFSNTKGKPVLAHGVMRVVNERHEREQRIAFLLKYDELTGQLNRTHLVEVLNESIASSKRYQTNGSFLLAAIDNLALINDTFGFNVADEVIATIGKRLKSVVRGGDAIGRYSGNKFGIVLNNCTEEDMEIAARRFRSAVSGQVIETGVGPVTASVSMGGVIYPRYGRTTPEIMIRAQEALDGAKAAGRATYVGYRRNVERESMRRTNIRMADEIITALNDGRVNLALQPVVHAKNGDIAFHEALMRVRRPDGTHEGAGRLIPAAEKLGFVPLVDRRVLDLAIVALENDPALQLSLNVSAETTGNPDWIASMLARIRSLRNIASRITVEITETAAIRDFDTSVRFVRALREHGCRVAIDDFGAGYTSFRNLRILDVDMVKIDGSFIQHLSGNEDDQLFVRTMIELAQNYGLSTVAEWVETTESAALLKGWGVDFLQGQLYGTPTPMEIDLPTPTQTVMIG